MAKIRNAKPKNSSGGYERLVGKGILADLIQKSQSTVISNGTELEKYIEKKIIENGSNIENLDVFIDKYTHEIGKGVYYCSKKKIKESHYSMNGDEPDFIIFDLSRHICIVMELKEGHVFDTKKVSAEQRMLEKYADFLGSRIPFMTDYKICCFNHSDKNEIQIGLKNKFTIDHISNGEELCSLLGISYEGIVEQRKEDMEDNYTYFISHITSDVVRSLHKVVDEESFIECDED